MFVFKSGQLTSSLRRHKRFAQLIRKTTLGCPQRRSRVIHIGECRRNDRPRWLASRCRLRKFMETTKANGSSSSQAPIEESYKRPLLCGFAFGMDSIATG
jgi:hypothetical protein